MRKETAALAAALVISMAAYADKAPETAPGSGTPGEGWILAWADEFDGGTIDRSKWTFDLGAGGWGNQESQRYTDRPENARLEDGCLVIEARREKLEGSYYTSARLKTAGLASFLHGRIEARISLPAGRGTWPAFWLLGDDISSVGWPACGEIDIMEHVGREPDTVLGTIHGPGYSGSLGPSSRVRPETAVEGAFHEYAIEWSPGRIDWLLDGKAYATKLAADVAPAPWVFDHGFFIILNLAVGGGLGGPVALDTPFPARMLVDYVRAYSRQP